MPWYNPSDPKQRNALLIGVVFVLALYPFHSFWYSKKTEEVAALQARFETLETQNLRAQVTSARGGGELEELMALYERHVSKLEELIPAAEEVAALIDDIAERARRTDVEMNSMVPEPAEAGGFYTKTSYEMVIVGEYHSVGRFLTEVASLSRIVTPVGVDINIFDRPTTFPEYESPVVANFRIETYVLPDQSAPPAPAGEGSG
jgi:type IV pilus assembly protein PilO